MLRSGILLFAFSLMPSTVWAENYFEQIGWVEPNSAVEYQYPQQLEELYRSNDNQLIWFDLHQSSQLEFQLELIDKAGISPILSKQLNQLRYLRNSNLWYQYDLLATDTLLAYMSYAELAKQYGKTWFFEEKITQPLPLPSEAALADLKGSMQSQQLDALIDTYTPDDDSYQALISTYLRIASRIYDVVPLYTQSTRLKRVGDILESREALLQRLEQVDVDLVGIEREIGYYDNQLEDAVKQFQRIHGLKADGIIGPNTIRWLNKSSKDRLKIIAVNAERSRIWPEQRNTIIVVNVPGYEMEYWFAGEQVFKSQVIVGRQKRPTPVMTSNLDSVILNPTWNVPWKIMVEDIIPAVQQDPNYLDKQNIKIIKSWTSSQIINPNMIDWYHTHPKAFPYRMRQMSGANNALGLYKFNTPNDRAIFLHDTPSKHLFEQPSRAFSSGCVRVKDADQLAALLLANQGLNLEEIQQITTQDNKSIPLRERIPVHIIYQTAWSEEGKVQYRDDIYRLDY
ncbi:L,D-transpeptidase family protein [Vibrio panuliri]|uniref:Peptidase n=1 Tax=Vibrio panuliri TaxID=1381081 RepID=A0ABX3FB71_9VIBR|nr:L,D-transpeptidase family protein [Vibrio panuliri]KAB1454227.1 L,D-transpeptidase family protein [Vibrio panuliri]OLQ88920.1 peptidase [Vibrio panuliri]